jgi:hypothetical protein
VVGGDGSLAKVRVDNEAIRLGVVGNAAIRGFWKTDR